MAATISHLKGIERGRATQAYEYAKQAFETQEKHEIAFENSKAFFKSENYASYAKKLPMMIKTNGLGATLAFIFSKRAKPKQDKDNKGRNKENDKNIPSGAEENPKNAYDLLYYQLSKWLMQKCVTTAFLFEAKDADLVEAVIQMKSHEYRTVTLETLALIAWVSRFAEGLIQGEAEETD